MRERLEAVLEKYGREVLCLPSEQSGRAFIQPVLEKRASHAHTPLGRADGRRWTYIGPGALALSVGDRLVCREERFVVREATAVYWLDERPLYWWAVLAREREA